MQDWCSRVPITKLEGAWEWIIAVYEYVFKGYHWMEVKKYSPIYEKLEVINAIESGMLESALSGLKQKHKNDWENWESWAKASLKDLETLHRKNRESSVLIIFNNSFPHTEGVYHDGVIKLFLWGEFVQNPPSFLIPLIKEDRELCKLFNISDAKHFSFGIDEKFPYQKVGERIFFYEVEVNLTPQGRKILGCFESSSNGVVTINEFLDAYCADNELALRTAMTNAFRNPFYKAFKESTAINKPTYELNRLFIVPEVIDKKYTCNLKLDAAN